MPKNLVCRAAGKTTPPMLWPCEAPAAQRTLWPMSGATIAGNTSGRPQRVDQLHHACALGAAHSRLLRYGIGHMTFWESVATLNPQKGPGFVQGIAVARAKQAVIPDLDTVVRQDVLQEPADEFLGCDGADLESPGLGVLVFEGDPAVFESEDAVVADRHTKDVRREILEGLSASANRLTMDNPVLFPDRRGDKVKHRGPAPRITQFGTIQDGQRLDRNQEGIPGWEPLTAIGRKPARGHQIVYMGMVVQGASPGVQDPDHANLSADTPWIQGEFLEGLG
jgi:hypothetical protein